MWLKIKDFLKQNESKIILSIGFILVSVLSFEAGIMKGQSTKQNQIVVNEGGSSNVCGTASEQAPEAQNLTQEASRIGGSANIPAQTLSADKQNCAYVGSKNSNKYHLPTCRWAKNIKPENVVCFSDENDAKLKGYLPDKNCIK
jgi:hypothetical protein